MYGKKHNVKMGKKATLLLTQMLFGIVTLILAVLTIAASFADDVSPQKSWFIAVLALGMTPLLVLNLISLIVWAIKRSFWVLLPLVAIAMNYTYITSIIQIDWRGDVVRSQERQFKVASYNIHGQGHKDDYDKVLASIMRYFASQNVDIICMQEFCDTPTWRESDSIFKQWPYYVVHSPNVGMQRAVFSKFPITDSEYIVFPQKTANGATRVDIDLPKHKLRLFNLHMQSTNIYQSQYEIGVLRDLGIEDPQGKNAFDQIMLRMSNNAISRAQQINMIRAKIDSAMTKRSVIVCGDFNDHPASYTYSRINEVLEDGFKAAGSSYGYTFKPIYKLFRIDYVLYSPEFAAIQYHSPSLDWSDHNPVIVELDIARNSSI